jgi:choline kinase
LGQLGDDTPKWLLDVAGTTIAERQLAGIAAAAQHLPGAVSGVRVVTGHAAAAVEAFAAAHRQHGLALLHNPVWAQRNNWFSVLLALRASAPDRRVVVMNGDLCAEPAWIASFLVAAATTASEALLAVDSARPVTDESMKVAVHPQDTGALRAIGKVGVSEPIGEYVGMLMAGGATLARLQATLERFEGSPEAHDEWYERAVAITASEGTRWQIWSTPDSRWVEIDDDRDHGAAVALGLGVAA